MTEGSFPESDRDNKRNKSIPRYITKILINFKNTEGNKKLDELMTDLEIFKRHYNQNLEKIKIESKKNLSSLYTTKLLIYNALEKHLIEISSSSNKEIRTDRINKLYLWYKEKIKIIEDLRKINYKSYKGLDEIIDEDLKILDEKNIDGEKDIKKEKEEKLNGNIDRKLDIHRNEEILDKKLLNEYQRKILSKILEERISSAQISEPIETNNDPYMKDNSELTKTLISLKNQEFSGGGNYSTFYSYKYGTNSASLGKFCNTEKELNNFRDSAKGGDHKNNFYPNYNKESKLYYPPLSRETKFSYSYFRPLYNFGNIYYENKIIEEKMKMQAEKRSQEEIKTHIEKMGQFMAKYKEEVNNKYEMKNVINMYVKTNDFGSNLLKKYKLKPSKSTTDMNDKSRNIKDLYKIMFSKNEGFNLGVSHINKQQSSKNIKHLKDELIKEQETNNNDKNIVPKTTINAFDINERTRKRFRTEKKIFSGIMGKINTNTVKNVENKFVLKPIKLNKIKIKMKVNKETVQNTRLDNIIKSGYKPSSEMMSRLMSTDNLLKTNKIYQPLCNIYKKLDAPGIDNKQEKNITNNYNNIKEEDDEEEEESFYHNFCLSLYDLGNLKKINQNKRNNTNYKNYNDMSLKRKGSKSKFEQLHKSYDLNKNNFLNLRRTVSDLKKGEYLNLIERLKTNKTFKKEKERKEDGIKKINLKKNIGLLNAIINPTEQSEYSQYFLPRMGTLLLRRTEESKTKKKGKT